MKSTLTLLLLVLILLIGLRHRPARTDDTSAVSELTFDIVFKSKEDFEAVKATGVITKELIAALYNLPAEQVLTFVYYDAANAIKATIPRRRAQGSIGETDMHGAQQHVPLMNIMIPLP